MDEVDDEDVRIIAPSGPSSLLLIDEEEQIVVDDHELLANFLQCDVSTRLKVVSIFGNTGDGKSHTLNHVFFNGQEVFRTSPEQHSCTVGVWVAYAPHHRALVIDTEGLLGTSKNENRRLRMLLKTLAISDVVIYRTRAERLHNDMFLFLSDASSAYWKYFAPELQAASQRNQLGYSVSTLGPSVVIFHETQFTQALSNNANSIGILPIDDDIDHQPSSDEISAEEFLMRRFTELSLSPKAFSAVKYVGTQTMTPPTDFISLKKTISELLQCNSVRSPRTIDVIYSSLQSLNENFINELTCSRPSLFPDYYFSCQTSCISCNARCELSTNHMRHDKKHSSTSKCKYQHHLDNTIMLCKKCYNQGREQVVEYQSWTDNDSSWFGIAKFAWSGYVIECPTCGIIYRSREHWYGNPLAEHGSVVVENTHVWSETCAITDGVSGSDIKGRKVIDIINNVSETVGNLTQPAQELLADKVAPDYWVPNSEIKVCSVCNREFGGVIKTKHHCRACGKGVCDDCSSHSMAVSWRGWGNSPVRVCDNCYTTQSEATDTIVNSTTSGTECTTTTTTNSSDFTTATGTDVTATTATGSVSTRYIAENVNSAIGLVGGIFTYPKQALIETVRPSYWVPDDEIIHCSVCLVEFTSSIDSYKHHCRSCGEGVCDKCSQQRKPVPSKGWDYPVRVCDNCLTLLS